MPLTRVSSRKSLWRGFAQFLADEQDGAVGDALELIEIGEPQPPLLLVFHELGAQTHARYRRTKIVTGGGKQPHAALDGAAEPRGEGIERSRRRPHFSRAFLRQERKDGVWSDRFDGVLQEHERLHHAMSGEDGDGRYPDSDQRQPFEQPEPGFPLRRQIGDGH